ncbi:unnamed protein product [Rangifer tarandus platyrhynchus]|uniref:Uncharacterized protein n=1 Tax=Rangifer tarandus platyrhynchus TaxID=3082113 RepID=A0AC59ZYL3_RANTA
MTSSFLPSGLYRASLLCTEPYKKENFGKHSSSLAKMTYISEQQRNGTLLLKPSAKQNETLPFSKEEIQWERCTTCSLTNFSLQRFIFHKRVSINYNVTDCE